MDYPVLGVFGYFQALKKLPHFYYLAHFCCFLSNNVAGEPKDIGLTDCRCAPKKCPLHEHQNAVLT